MKLINTSGNQDNTINAASNQVNYTDELIEIIQDLDGQIEEWKKISNCSNPEELSTLISKLEEQSDARNILHD